MVKRACCFIMVIMVFTTFYGYSATLDSVMREAVEQTLSSNVTEGESFEYSSPTDAESLLNPLLGIEYSIPCYAHKNGLSFICLI